MFGFPNALHQLYKKHFLSSVTLLLQYDSIPDFEGKLGSIIDLFSTNFPNNKKGHSISASFSLSPNAGTSISQS